MSITPVPTPPPARLTGDARRWDAARDEYLAGSPAEAVCRRHDLRLSTFRRRAREKGWRRKDQEPEAPPPQHAPLVIPDAPPGAIRDGAPLTAAQMVDKAWSHVQAAVAAGRLIEARGWLRLYKDLKPFARYEEIEAREARMEREAADRRAAEAADVAAPEAPAEDRLVIPEAPSGAIRDETVGLPLHCFSAPESHAPSPADEDPETAGPISTSDLLRLATRLATISQQVEQAAHDEAVRLSLHCFSPAESHDAPGALEQAMRDLQTDILALKGAEPRSDARPGAP